VNLLSLFLFIHYPHATYLDHGEVASNPPALGVPNCSDTIEYISESRNLETGTLVAIDGLS